MFLLAILLLVGDTTAQQPDKGYHGLNKADELSRHALKHSRYHSGLAKKLKYPAKAITAPEQFDWRDYGVVTRVKDQGSCTGASWIFSAVGHIEGQYAIKHKKCIAMSEQQALECARIPTSVRNVCYEAWPHYLFLTYQFGWIKPPGGIYSEDSYPYIAVPMDECRMYKNDSTPTLTKVTDFQVLAPHDEDTLRQLLYETGPLVVGLDGTALNYYTKGVFIPGLGVSCDRNVDHFMLLVGYGIDGDGTKYWTLKNCWGEKWGENGYFRLERDRKVGLKQFPEPACSIGITYTAMCTVT